MTIKMIDMTIETKSLAIKNLKQAQRVEGS